MSPYATRKRTASQTKPRPSPRRKMAAVTKVTTKNKSISSKASKIKGNTKTSDKKSSRLRRTSLKEQSDTSAKSDTSTRQEKKRNPVTHKTVRTRSDKASGKTKKDETYDESKKNKDKNDVKKRIIKKKINQNVSSLRQMSLKESFSKQSVTRRLRSQTSKNSKPDTVLIAKNLTPDRQNSIVVLKDINIKKAKVPVYKAVPADDSVKEETEIYDFKFDADDTAERLAKKRKKRVIKKSAIKGKTNIFMKHTIPKKVIKKKKQANSESQENKKKGTAKVAPTESSNVPKKVVKKEEPTTTQSTENEKDSAEIKPTKSSDEFKNDLLESIEEKADTDKENLVPAISPDDVHAGQKVQNTIAKPTIVSVENLTKKRVKIMDNSSTINSEDFKPFRPTNIFNNNKLSVPRRSMQNYSLLEKSLSPILKSSENFNVDSPWRAPPLLTFSQVKNVFQSTPRYDKYDISSGKYIRTVNNESKNSGNTAKVRDIIQKNNENNSTERSVNINTPKKKSLTTARRFGTEITNLEHSLQSNNPEENERIIHESENTVPNMQSVGTVNSNMNNVSQFDEDEDKENAALNYQTPKTAPKKVKKIRSRGSQETVSNVQTNEQKENMDPQPGPSGVKIRATFNEDKVLRQSNLNNFLNLTEMPQSTEIKTPHGIFDDAISTPVSGKPVKIREESNMGIANAFGFTEDDSNQNESPSDPQVKSNEEKERKTVTKDIGRTVLKPIRKDAPVRLPTTFVLTTGSIEKNLKDRMKSKNIVENKETEAKKLPVKQKKAPQIDVMNFSDTFDILSEAGETSHLSDTSVPLFADLEPTRFTKPPRYSYKRKRIVQFAFPEESSGEEEEGPPEREVKRKKIGKLNKKDEKRLQDWIQSVNQTFEEIDQHDLLVE